MQYRLIHTVTALALAALSTLALAQVPARVGRIALAQGNVTIAGDVGAASEAALLNWPVTSHNTITTARGARTEVRIGSTSLRLDGDSSLEIDELDDDNLRVRLNYGSASVRVIDANTLAGFEVSTPQALLRMREPGRMRIDVERQRDTTSVSVFDGLGLIDAAGGTLPLRAGKRADVVGEDIDTSNAVRDSFDDWSAGRDQYQDRSMSARYVTSDMTGYEDLDRYGAWSQDAEYGDLWIPQVDSTWVPYGDGRWTWLDPWGWTWVDNAPWGYAPFHYGRWVQVNQRWAWAPGRHNGRPVWAPALVGWVGGDVAYGGRPRLSQGWYPLSPRERFTPGYRASQDQIARLNFGPQRFDPRRDNDQHRRGLTVLPQAQFGQHGQVVVPRQGRDGGAGAAALGAMPPPRPPQANRLENRGDERRRDDGGLRGAVIQARGTPPNQLTAQPRQPVTIVTPTPVLPGVNQAPPQRFENRDRDGRNARDNEERRARPQFQPPAPQQQVQQQAARPVPAAPPERTAQRNEGGMAGLVRNAARPVTPAPAASAPPPRAAPAPAAHPEPRPEAREGRVQQER